MSGGFRPVLASEPCAGCIRFRLPAMLGNREGRIGQNRHIMAELTEAAGSATKLRDIKIVGLVGAAHFMSHVYVIMLPPLFLFARAEYDVGFAQLGFAMAVFGFFSATLQTPAGFVVDRLGSR